MSELETTLANWLDAKEALLFGRASTGLYALFRALAGDEPEGEVLIPELCCETIPMAAMFAGLRPVMVDVDRESLSLSVDDVAAKLGPATRAVLLVYLFGIPVDIEPLQALQEQHDFLLIEDIAQAVGGEFRGQRLGSRGDATVISFDDKKIVRGAGGAVVVRENRLLTSALATIQRQIESSYTRPPSGLAASLGDLTRSLTSLARSDRSADVASTFRSLAPHYEPVVVQPLPRTGHGPIADQLHALAAELETRRARHARYAATLHGSNWHVIPMPDDAMCWRAPVVATDPDAALDAARRLLAAGIPASNHYFPLGHLIDGCSMPTADAIGRRLLNLWVDHAISDADVDRTIEVLVG